MDNIINNKYKHMIISIPKRNYSKSVKATKAMTTYWEK